jgi:hypothetical protein
LPDLAPDWQCVSARGAMATPLHSKKIWLRFDSFNVSAAYFSDLFKINYVQAATFFV